MLEEVKDNLVNNFIMFGLVENLDRFLSLFLKISGVPPIIYAPANINTDRPQINEHSLMFEIAAEYNRFDLELYDWAQKYFSNFEKNMLASIPQETRISPQEFISVHETEDQSIEFYLHSEPIPEGSISPNLLKKGKAIHQQARMVIASVPT